MYDNGAGGYGMDGGFGLVVWLVAWLGFMVFLLWVYGRIVGRAGYSPWWALITLVPLLNLVMLWVFAFVRWPALDGGAVASGSPPPAATPPGGGGEAGGETG